MARTKKYTDDDFTDAIKNSVSISQTLKKLNLRPTGGNYVVAKRRINLLNLDTSHFTGQGYLKGKTHNWKKSIPLNEILIKDSTYTNTSGLRKRLIKEKIFEQKCYRCGLTYWLGKEISLELEHINGDRFDNRIENLTILCPNCHSLTPTYRGRKKKINRILYCRPKKHYFCKNCNKEITGRTKTGLCLKCSIINNRKVKDRPYIEQLLQEIEETNYCIVGRKYGVSDTTIRNWIRK